MHDNEMTARLKAKNVMWQEMKRQIRREAYEKDL